MLIMITIVLIFILSTPTKFRQKLVSAVHQPRSEVDSPFLEPAGDDHQTLGVARALFSFTTRNSRYEYFEYTP